MKHRVVVEIDLKALVRNYRRIATRVRPLDVLAVLKANAYGLSVGAYAEALMDAGCRHFGVAEPFEALELVKKGAPNVQILSSILPDEIAEMVRKNVVLPVVDLDSAKRIASAATRLRKRARVHIKLDTGMGRLGILSSREEDIPKVISTIREIEMLPALDCEGIFSHCPMAYDPKDPFTAHQVKLFKTVLGACAREGFRFPLVHMAASDAINNFPETCRKPFTLVRTGINLHGSFDPEGRKALHVEPVLTMRTVVAQVRRLPAGTTLGYGRTWCLNRPSKIATISAGYADGIPLALTNRGFVLIKGVRCPIVGRISMDYTTVDVSDVEAVEAGDEVVCLGKSGRETITPDDWGQLKGTHPYDILCSIGSRVKREVKR